MRFVILAIILCGCGSKAAAPTSEVSAPSTVHPIDAEVALFNMKVEAHGYSPSEFRAKAGSRVRLVVTRTADKTCGTVLKFPALDIERTLPLDESVTIDLTMPASGSVRFTCGMEMFEGSIVAIP